MTTPNRIDSRPRMPRNRTETRTIEDKVTSAVTGAFMKLSLADGARLKPIRATIEPVTRGRHQRLEPGLFRPPGR
jgi:hypothetical protein